MKTVYRIKATYNYYPGTFYAPTNGFLRNEEDNTFLEFPTREAAEAELKDWGLEYKEYNKSWMCPGIPRLGNRQAGPTKYQIYKFNIK